MRRLHVLHVIKGLGRGGAETLLEHAQRSVDSDAFRLSFVYFVPEKDALVGSLERLGADVRLIRANGPGEMFAAVRSLAEHIEHERVDLVHAHLPLSAVVARLAARRAGVPVVYTEHNLHERHHPATRWANRMTWRRQRLVIAVSDAVRDSIRRHQGDRVPVRVVPNGVPIELLQERSGQGREFRERHSIPVSAPLIGQVAVFRAEKRLGRWLEAAAALRERLPEAHFVLVGDGPERSRIERRASELQLEDALRLPGLLEDATPALDAMDVHLITSRFEGLPLVLLESMALGIPAVATAVGGIPEAIVHGETGVLLPPDASAEKLATALGDLLADDAHRQRLGAAAAERAARRFSTRTLQRSLEQIYREVVA